jgi:hypothetical protein
MRRFKGECAHFCFNNCFIYTHDGESAKFSTNLPETDNSALLSFSVAGAPYNAENSFFAIRRVMTLEIHIKQTGD